MDDVFGELGGNGGFSAVGLIFGNLNALALEPLGHIAGTASSVMGGVSTMVSAMIAAPLAALYNGTVLPLMLAVAACGVGALLAMTVGMVPSIRVLCLLLLHHCRQKR